MDLANFIPRVLINERDLPATGLVQPGSRIRWRLLIAGQQPALDDYRAWVKEHLARGQRLEDVREARPELRVSLDRSGRFLRLSALMSVFLAAAALGLAARRYVERHLDTVALLRTLCLTQRQILALFLRQYALLAAFAVAVGVSAGYLAQLALSRALAGLFQARLPPAGPLPALQGALIGVTLLFGFGLPPLLRLRGVSPLRVLRRDQTPPGNARQALALGGATLLGLLAWQAREPRMALLSIGALVVTVTLASLAAYVAAAADACQRRAALRAAQLEPAPRALGGAGGGAQPGDDGADAADGGARRLDLGVAAPIAGRRSQSIRHQYPARGEKADRRLLCRARFGGSRDAADGAREAAHGEQPPFRAGPV
jgi:putative ABC transport system permease protein